MDLIFVQKNKIILINFSKIILVFFEKNSPKIYGEIFVKNLNFSKNDSIYRGYNTGRIFIENFGNFFEINLDKKSEIIFQNFLNF